MGYSQGVDIVNDGLLFKDLLFTHLVWYHSLGVMPGRSKTNLSEVIMSTLQVVIKSHGI